MADAQPESAKEGRLTKLPVDRLLLDPQNPRLASSGLGEKPSQFEIAELMWTDEAVDELVLSIAANGYFEEEPVFVIPQAPEREHTKYYVVEGNRRLTAVRILLDDNLRKKLRATRLPTIDEQAKTALRELPVSIYPDRRSLWAYVGFKHINSPKQWDAYSKAQFVAYVHDTYEIELSEISKSIGDQHETVRRMYRGYKVLKQAEEDDIFDIQDRYASRFYFSHWYTALSYAQFQKFLGIEPEDFEKPKPVSKSHYDELGELLTWIYGRTSKKTAPVVRKQNPDLNDLRDVIDSPSALDALRSGYPLKRSHEISVGDERRFREALTRAKEEIQQANGTVTLGYKGDDMLYQTIHDIAQVAERVRVEMEQIRKNKTEQQ